MQAVRLRWAGALLQMLLALVLVAALLGALPTGALAGNPETDVRAIAQKLQCPVCEGTSVADSPSQVAQEMRRVIGAKLEAGESERQVIQYFVDRYGPGILREPPRTGFYSAVWWVPGLALLVGAAMVYGVVRRRRGAQGQEATAEGPELSQEEMESYKERIQGELDREGA